MIDNIIDGIVSALRGAFPEVKKVYTEQVKQGLIEPCFMVRLVNPSNGPFPSQRYLRKNLFSVQYLPESSTDTKAEVYTVCDRLFLALEYVAVGGDLVRGTGMNAEYTDGALTFLVNYDLFVRTETELDPMGDLTEIRSVE